MQKSSDNRTRFWIHERLSEKGLTGCRSARLGSLRPAAPAGDLSGGGCDPVVVELQEVVGGGDQSPF